MIRSKTVYADVSKTNSILFTLLFVYAATSKFIGFTHLNTQLEGFLIIGDYATWVTWGVPIVQRVIATLFMLPKLMLLAFYTSFSLMTLFTTSIILVLNFSDDVLCFCADILPLNRKDHLVCNMNLIGLVPIGGMTINKQVRLCNYKNTKQTIFITYDIKSPLKYYNQE